MNKKTTHTPFNKVYVKFNLIGLLMLALWLPITAATPRNNVYAIIKVSGTVVDENNQPMPGVGIRVKNTNTGVTTNVDGKYSISAEQGATLVFSFVGYTTQEVVASNSA